jgi:hypothetical protein
VKERLELVTSFASLKTGMIVFVDCQRCTERHRFILANSGVYTGITADRQFITQACFDVLPIANCGGDSVGEHAVASRRVYRVIDSLESSSHTTTQKPKKLVRAR